MADNISRNIWDIFNGVTSDVKPSKDSPTEQEGSLPAETSNDGKEKEQKKNDLADSSETIYLDLIEETEMFNVDGSKRNVVLPSLSSISSKLKLGKLVVKSEPPDSGVYGVSPEKLHQVSVGKDNIQEKETNIKISKKQNSSHAKARTKSGKAKFKCSALSFVELEDGEQSSSDTEGGVGSLRLKINQTERRRSSRAKSAIKIINSGEISTTDVEEKDTDAETNVRQTKKKKVSKCKPSEHLSDSKGLKWTAFEGKLLESENKHNTTDSDKCKLRGYNEKKDILASLDIDSTDLEWTEQEANLQFKAPDKVEKKLAFDNFVEVEVVGPNIRDKELESLGEDNVIVNPKVVIEPTSKFAVPPSTKVATERSVFSLIEDLAQSNSSSPEPIQISKEKVFLEVTDKKDTNKQETEKQDTDKPSNSNCTTGKPVTGSKSNSCEVEESVSASIADSADNLDLSGDCEEKIYSKPIRKLKRIQKKDFHYDPIVSTGNRKTNSAEERKQTLISNSIKLPSEDNDGKKKGDDLKNEQHQTPILESKTNISSELLNAPKDIDICNQKASPDKSPNRVGRVTRAKRASIKTTRSDFVYEDILQVAKDTGEKSSDFAANVAQSKKDTDIDIDLKKDSLSEGRTISSDKNSIISQDSTSASDAVKDICAVKANESSTALENKNIHKPEIIVKSDKNIKFEGTDANTNLVTDICIKRKSKGKKVKKEGVSEIEKLVKKFIAKKDKASAAKEIENIVKKLSTSVSNPSSTVTQDLTTSTTSTSTTVSNEVPVVSSKCDKDPHQSTTEKDTVTDIVEELSNVGDEQFDFTIPGGVTTETNTSASTTKELVATPVSVSTAISVSAAASVSPATIVSNATSLSTTTDVCTLTRASTAARFSDVAAAVRCSETMLGPTSHPLLPNPFLQAAAVAAAGRAPYLGPAGTPLPWPPTPAATPPPQHPAFRHPVLHTPQHSQRQYIGSPADGHVEFSHIKGRLSHMGRSSPATPPARKLDQATGGGEVETALDLSRGLRSDETPLDLTVRKTVRSPVSSPGRRAASNVTIGSPQKDGNKAVGRVVPLVLETRQPKKSPVRCVRPLNERGQPIDSTNSLTSKDLGLQRCSVSPMKPKDINSPHVSIPTTAVVTNTFPNFSDSGSKIDSITSLHDSNFDKSFPFATYQYGVPPVCHAPMVPPLNTAFTTSQSAVVSVSSPIVIQPDSCHENTSTSFSSPNFTSVCSQSAVPSPTVITSYTPTSPVSVLKVPSFSPSLANTQPAKSSDKKPRKPRKKKDASDTDSPKIKKERQPKQRAVKPASLSIEEGAVAPDGVPVPPLISPTREGQVTEQDDNEQVSPTMPLLSPQKKCPDPSPELSSVGSTRKYKMMAQAPPKLNYSLPSASDLEESTPTQKRSPPKKSSRKTKANIKSSKDGSSPFNTSNESEKIIDTSCKFSLTSLSVGDKLPSKFRISKTGYFQDTLSEVWKKPSIAENSSPANPRKQKLSDKRPVPREFKNTWKEHLFQHKRNVFKLPEKLVHVPNNKLKKGFQAEIQMPHPDPSPKPVMMEKLVSNTAISEQGVDHILDEKTGDLRVVCKSEKVIKEHREPACSYTMPKEVLKHIDDVIDEVATYGVVREKKEAPNVFKGTDPSESSRINNITEILRKFNEANANLKSQTKSGKDSKENKAKHEMKPDCDIIDRSIEMITSSIDQVSAEVMAIARVAEANMKKRRRRKKKNTPIPSHANLGDLIERIEKSATVALPDHIVNFEAPKMEIVIKKVNDSSEANSEAVKPVDESNNKVNANKDKSRKRRSTIPKTQQCQQSSDKDILQNCDVSPSKKRRLLSKTVVPLKLLDSWQDLSPAMRKVELNRYEESQKSATRKLRASSASPTKGSAASGRSGLRSRESSTSPRKTRSSPQKSPVRSRSTSPRKKQQQQAAKEEAVKLAQQRRMLRELENSKGYVADRRGKKETVNLFEDPSKLDREARMLQMQLRQFRELEIKGALQDKQDKDRKRVKAQQLKKRAMNHGKPKRSPKSTGDDTTYYKDDAYDEAMEAEAAPPQREETPQHSSTPRRRPASTNRGKGSGGRRNPSIEYVVDEVIDDEETLHSHYGGTPGSLSRHDTLILPTHPRRDFAVDDDAMSTATSTSFMSFDGGRLHVPPEVRKLTVNKDTGETIMHKVARHGKEEIARWLCQTGYVDVRKADNAGYTGLHESSSTGHVNISRILLAHGLDVNAASTTNGIRPLHDAIENDHIEMARLLLSYGADPTRPTFSGSDITSMIRSKEMREFLTGYMVDLNGPTRNNEREIPWFLDEYPIEKDDEDEVLGCEVLAGVPADQTHADLDIEFECYEEEPIPTYYLEVPPASTEGEGDRLTAGPAGPGSASNYVLLLDVLDRLNTTKESFRRRHPAVPLARLSWAELAQQLRLASGGAGCLMAPWPRWMPEEGSSKCTAPADLVPWTPEVRALLGAEVMTVSLADGGIAGDNGLVAGNDGVINIESSSDEDIAVTTGSGEDVDPCEVTRGQEELQADTVRRVIDFDANQNVGKKTTMAAPFENVSYQFVEVPKRPTPKSQTTTMTTDSKTKSKKTARKSTTGKFRQQKSASGGQKRATPSKASPSDPGAGGDSTCSIKIAGVCSLNSDDAMKILGATVTPPRALAPGRRTHTISISDSSDMDINS